MQRSRINPKNISVLAKQKHVVELISKDTGIGTPEVGIGNRGLFGTAKEIAIGLNMLPEMPKATPSMYIKNK